MVGPLQRLRRHNKNLVGISERHWTNWNSMLVDGDVMRSTWQCATLCSYWADKMVLSAVVWSTLVWLALVWSAPVWSAVVTAPL